MDSKLFSKCEILDQVWRLVHDDPNWSEFFRIYDIAIPLARLIVDGCAEPTERGIECIEQTWLDLCRIVMVDSEEEYEFFGDMLAIGLLDE